MPRWYGYETRNEVVSCPYGMCMRLSLMPRWYGYETKNEVVSCPDGLGMRLEMRLMVAGSAVLTVMIQYFILCPLCSLRCSTKRS